MEANAPTPTYSKETFAHAAKGDEVALTAISKSGNAVQRFGEIDTVHDNGVTIKLLDRGEVPQYRRVLFNQMTYVLFL